MSDPSLDDPLRLPELLAARAFREVGGLVGTLTATLDLALKEAGGNAGVSLPAAVEAAAELSRRVRLLRAAWGPAESDLDTARLRELALAPPGASRVRLELSALPAATVFPASVGRVLLNVVLLATECLPRGGTLALAEAGGGAVLATLAGPRAAWPDGFAALLADERAAGAALTDPGRVTAPLLALIARALDVRLSLLMPAGAAPRRAPSPLLIEVPPARIVS